MSNVIILAFYVSRWADFPCHLASQKTVAVDTSSLPADVNLDGVVDDDDDELALQLGPTTYELPPPKPLDTPQTDAFLRATMQRFASTGASLSSSDVALTSASDGRQLAALARGPPPSEMWVLLFIRMVTRGQRDTTGSSPERAKNEKMEDDDGMIGDRIGSSTDIKGKGRSQDEVWARNDLLRGTILEYVVEDLPAR